MWYVLGLVTFTLWFGWKVLERLSGGWLDESGVTSAGRSFRYRSDEYKGNLRGLVVGLERPAVHVEFSLHREGTASEIAKSLGIAIEAEVGDPSFDRRIYIATDLVPFVQRLRSDAALRAAVLAIFADRGVSQPRPQAIHCVGDRLWAEVECEGQAERARDRAATVATELAALEEALRGVRFSLAERLEDPLVRRAMVLLALSSASGAVGLVAAYGLYQATHGVDVLRDVGDLVPALVFVGTLGVAVLLGLTRGLLGRSPRMAMVVFDMALIGCGGWWLTSAGYLHRVNRDLDAGAATIEHVTVLGKRSWEHRGRKRRLIDHHYEVRLQAADGSTVTLEVPQAWYWRVREGEVAELHIRPGAFRAEWYADLRGAR